MKPQFWVLCIVVLCCSLLARAQDFEAGLAAYERGDYQVALNELAPLAEQGDAQAQYRIGQMHRDGKGVPRDAQKAVRLFQAAAISGHTDSQQALEMILLLGYGVPADESEAFKWLSLAAEHDPSRQYLLGGLYENAEHYAEAANWYRKAAEKGESAVASDDLGWKATTGLAQYSLGGLYERGRGVPQDYTQAAEWYRLAAEHGLREAQLILGRMLWEGDVVPQDFAKASHFFQEAAKGYRTWAEVGNLEDQFVLGTMYERGEIWEVDYREAAKWYRRAADRGHAQAQYRSASFTRWELLRVGHLKTFPRRKSGSARPPSRGTLERRLSLVFFTRKATACHKTMLRQQGGTAKQPKKGTHLLRYYSQTYISREGDYHKVLSTRTCGTTWPQQRESLSPRSIGISSKSE